jgi:hypothetical protein
VRTKTVAIFALLALAAPSAARPAAANSGGTFRTLPPFDPPASQQGCTCHGLPQLANTTTQLFLMGLPEEGYLPGEEYVLDVWVLGVAVPFGGAGVPWAGFHLDASAGKLEAIDAAVQTRDVTECMLVEQRDGCKVGDPYNPCPPCDGETLIRTEATHTGTTKGFFYSVRWTAPLAGEVKFHLAGNVVNANGSNDSFDFWSAGPEQSIGPAPAP